MASTRAVALLVVGLSGLAAFLQGCGGGGGSTNSITDVAGKNKDLSTLVTALTSAGLIDTLSGAGPFTVFAPSNEAFKKLEPALLTYLLNSKDELIKVLQYHVASGEVKSGDLKDGEEVKTLQGSNVTVSVTKKGNATTIKINGATNGATVTTADVTASNGVVHIIDTVLIPKGLSLPKIPDLAASANLTTLVKALKAAKLLDTLSAAGPYTVFAPTDKAFAAVPDIDAILKDVVKLTKILRYHVVSDEVLSTKLKNGEEIKTLEGKSLSINISGSDVFVNKAKVTKADVVAINGVVHVIDAVLIPPDMPKPPSPSPPSPPSCSADILSDVNCDGEDNMLNVPKKTKDDCCKWCTDTIGCKAWTWNQDKKMDPLQRCYLKRGCNKQTQKKGVISGKMLSEEQAVQVVV